ncbi:4-hydroxythreonine-4-phosphate dehydrogenase PdxA [Aurantibacter sp.]|uniref:4-hydroxythreonine-4-phosphate dehydrogenase PdxA n=1 Tax=Aurantibacter sp. TaxID=2807103 RepID=UPI0035C813F7
MNNIKKVVLGLSVGDLNGIGLEIILRIFQDARMFDFCTPVIFGSQKSVNYVKNHLNLNTHFNFTKDLEKLAPNKVNVFETYSNDFTISFGEENPKIGKIAIESFTKATKALKDDLIDVLVTAPINKHNIQSEEFNFPGHTDYLNQELEGDSLMLLTAGNLRVGLLTDHVAIKNVATKITPDLIISKIDTIHKTLVQDFGISKPKIAVLGLNPHTGDNGVIGEEDDVILRPTLIKIKDSGKLVYGPYSADSFFGSDTYKTFDAIIATYHDQGLIPFKTLSFGEGVNFTAGLSKIRTSPDHGTAYEIAGKGIANINSFNEAIFEGIKLFKNRKLYSELSQNPLKSNKRKI